jgi:hypothetical protein
MVFLAWLNLGAGLLLLVLGFALYVDARGKRRTIAALQAQATGLSRDLELRSARLGPLARTQVAPQRPAVALLAFSTPRAGTPAALPPPLPVPSLHLPSGVSDEIADRYVALCEASRTRGEPADHCDGPACGTLCRCGCVGCMRAGACLTDARLEAAKR